MNFFLKIALQWKTIPSKQSPQLKIWLNHQKNIYPWIENNGELLFCIQNNITAIPICEIDNCSSELPHPKG